MLAPLTEAIRRFRHRLRLAALLRGMAAGFFVAAVSLAALLLANHLWRGQFVDGWVVAGWVSWSVAALVGLIAGVACAARVGPSPRVPSRLGFGRRGLQDQQVIEHLEQRLSTNGLLLAAADDVALSPAFRAQLEQRLREVPSVLPAVRWRSLIWRPLAAAVILAAMHCWPVPAPTPRAAEAISLAVERLAKQVEELAELSPVPEITTDELRHAVGELQERVDAADVDAWRDVLWREVDQLQDRLERERRLASAAAGDRAQGVASVPGEPSAQGDPAESTLRSSTMLAAAMEKLQAVDAESIGSALSKLPDSLRDSLAAAVLDAAREDGSFDPAKLPQDPKARAALAAALSEAAREAQQELASAENGSSSQNHQQAQAELAAVADELAANLQDLAQGENAVATPDAGVPEGGSVGEKDERDAAANEALGEGLAQAAAKLAESGALDLLPKGLQEAMAEAAMGAIESFDFDQLKSLLPSDPAQLQALADAVAKLAENTASKDGVPGEGSGSGGGPGDPKNSPQSPLSLSPEKRAELMELAKDLRRKMGNAGAGGGAGPKGSGQLGQAGPGQSGELGQPGELGQSGELGQPGPGQAGAPSQAGSAGNSGTGTQPTKGLANGRASGSAESSSDQGGHAALRLTEDTRGGVAVDGPDFELPGVDPAELPQEWMPNVVEKVAPEDSDIHGARGNGASGRVARTGSRGGASDPKTAKGKATWQLRLMPRHRDVVRRFFAEKNK